MKRAFGGDAKSAGLSPPSEPPSEPPSTWCSSDGLGTGKQWPISSTRSGEPARPSPRCQCRPVRLVDAPPPHRRTTRPARQKTRQPRRRPPPRTPTTTDPSKAPTRHRRRAIDGMSSRVTPPRIPHGLTSDSPRRRPMQKRLHLPAGSAEASASLKGHSAKQYHPRDDCRDDRVVTKPLHRGADDDHGNDGLEENAQVGYSLRAPARKTRVPSVPDRDAQFRHLNALVEAASRRLHGHVADRTGARSPISGNYDTGPRLRGRDRDDVRAVRLTTPARGGRRE
jgi:hypothetical protein